MTRWGIGALVLLVAGALLGEAHAARLCSWNIQNLGWGEQKAYAAVAHVADHCDFVAVQEAMNDEGLERLQSQLERRDESWAYIASDAIGRGGYREMYAFFHRTGTVDYVDGAVVFLDRDDRFAREPFSARFRTDAGTEFAAGTVHVLYGDGVADRLPEIRTLASYWDWLAKVYPEAERILLGDFNLSPGHRGFAALRRQARALVTEGATTLSSIDGRYANLYDNIWISKDSELDVEQAGILQFPQLLRTRAGKPVTHKWARRHVSDHAPVYLVIDGAVVQRTARRVTGASGSDAQADSDNEVRGNRNSKIYHLPDCPSFDRIAERNRVPFASERAAREAGYRKAGNC